MVQWWLIKRVLIPLRSSLMAFGQESLGAWMWSSVTQLVDCKPRVS